VTGVFEEVAANDLAAMFDGLPEHEHAPHLTFIEVDDSFRCFGPSDRTGLMEWWSTRWPSCMVRTSTGRLVVLRRDPTPMRVAKTDVPVVRLSMCIIENGAMMALDAGRARNAYNVDADTGRALPSDPSLVFVDFAPPSGMTTTNRA